MKINIREGKIAGSKTFVGPNLKKETVVLDKFGNEIDPRTKQIINRNVDKE